MKIIVLIKQVPVVSAMKLDPGTKTLKRAGVPLEISAFDVRALVKAVDLRDRHGGEVVALTMGPPSAKDALRECLALGADRGILLTDGIFAGSDTLATARALAAAVRREGFDLILCGKSSVDAETGQVGPEVAEFLDIPQMTYAKSIAVEVGKIVVERELDEGTETLEAAPPCLVTATEDLAPEKFATQKTLKDADGKPIVEWSASDLGEDTGGFGRKGSPTWVASIESAPTSREPKIFEGGAMEEICREAAEAVRLRGAFDYGKKKDHPGSSDPVSRPDPDGAGPVWVVAEVIEGVTRPVTFELLSKARELAARSGRVLEAVVIGEAPRDQFQSLAAFGASKILHMGRPDLTPYTAESHGAALANLIQSRNPSVLLVPSTSRGRDYSPRTAARLGLGLTGDCIDLNINDEGRLVMIKPAFGGSVVAPIQSRTRPEMATVRPGMLQKAEAASARTLEVERVDPGEIAPPRVRVLSASRRSDAEGVALDDAPVIVGVGRGIGGPQNMEMVRTFAGALSAPLGATRVVTDAGWLPRQHQIGLTGRAVAPRLYIAVGVSGAFEHMVGLRRAETILAINKNPKAGIFKNCNFGIVGDFAEVLPLLGPALAKAGAIREKTG